MIKQQYCTSCGNPIPDGQGKSCSMCYGDLYWGKDGYYLDWLENMERQRQNERNDFSSDQERLQG